MTTDLLRQMNIDIETARQKASFSAKDMSTVIYGHEMVLDIANKLRDLLNNEPLAAKAGTEFLDHLGQEKELSDVEVQALSFVSDLSSPLTLHFAAFIAVIEAQGTEEQAAKWVDAANKLAIMGCYAQTELGHGSNVQGLRTTATYDRNTDEFLIHSPDLTAAKWWIGGLGLAATHCVCQAQLIIDGKNFGPHIFIVPVRSTKDRKPIKGVTVGEIGPKAYGGFNTVDNGFAMFDQVRIPRDNMLMRFAKVTNTGEYTKPVHNKLSYGSMVKLRVGMIAEAGMKLGRAATIATRYTTVRRQFHGDAPNKDGLEKQVISYSSVQHRLMPLISLAYAMVFAGQTIALDFQEMNRKLMNQDASMLPDIHLATCALKVWCTRRSTDGQEECRKAMGGHGYSIFSGIGQIFATAVPSNTYEGDNYVLAQQVGRGLLKHLGTIAKGGKVNNGSCSYMNYLASADATSPVPLDNAMAKAILDPQVQEHIFGLRAARLVADLGQQLKSGRAWSDVNMECWHIAFAHAEYTLLTQFHKKIQSLSADDKIVEPVRRLANLFALTQICHFNTAPFLTTGAIRVADMGAIQSVYRELIAGVAQDAVAYTDAFHFSDNELNSALGAYDGRAYERLWEAVQANPLNTDQGRKDIDECLLKILHEGENKKIAAKL
ncbi:acyl-CoA oxidase [Hesseltinella vesiculosa]|uniref:Acyl-coenzyme A oxidase n=1 Tax=Hesseltinella vesiculosa TaxID=101127 RepID=A0A1X2GTB8_9FUNG|nr:acyl-CoA oxidase [Hesseltinella vesiculosa]